MDFTEDELAFLHADAGDADGDLELLRARAEDVVNRRNNASVDDFAGLSPNEMTSFLYHAFDSPGLIQLPDTLSIEPSAPILDLLLPLFERLTQKALKLTAKGNLPTAFVKEMVSGYAPRHYPGTEILKRYAHNEDSFLDLHVARIVADLAGLVYKRHGNLHLTKKAAKLIDEHGSAGVYPVLLRTYVSKFNWGYSDGYEEFVFIQHSWAFSCFLLQTFGDQPRPESFYVERFLTAFPALLAEVRDRPYSRPEETVGRCYALRALRRFFGFLGLAEYSWEKKSRGEATATIECAPLLMDAVRLQRSSST